MVRSSTATSPPDTSAAPAHGRWALLACALGFAIVQLDVSVVNVAVRPMGAELGGSVAGLQWVVNGYTVVFAALIMSAGVLGDRIGAKRALVAGSWCSPWPRSAPAWPRPWRCC